MDRIKEKLKLLPNNPGCYLMLDKNERVVYVGKAKNLKNRVKSYFTGAHNLKTTKLISEIADFSYIQTKNELEALILEINLIKEHLPKYNVKLVDDSSYPYIVITDETHPQIIVSRDLKKDKGLVFGPYPNVYSARETVKLLNKMYPFRKCDIIPKTACLYYHIGECLAPCIKKEEIDYKPLIKEVSLFLKGDTKKVINKLKELMLKASENLEFEKALEYKNMISAINLTTEKQVVSLNDFKDRDFIAYQASKEEISIQILVMRKGKIVDAKNEIIPKYIDLSDQVVSYLLQYYDNKPIPDEICLKEGLDVLSLKELFKTKIVIPQKGNKKKLVDLAYKNASYELKHHELLEQRIKEKNLLYKDAFNSFLGLKAITRIEAFDNSHVFGSNAISVMVVFELGKPKKKEYRKYTLKQTAKGDDYGAFKEVLYRRYQRALLEKQKLPDLIIVDGGKGQVSAAKKTITALGLDIPVMGLKKDLAHKLTSVVYKNQDFLLEKRDPLYLYLSNISEEVHRFALDFHTKKRRKTFYKSHLDFIKGVGEKRKKKLLEKFTTIDKMIIGTVLEYKEIGINEKLRTQIITHLKERVENEKNNTNN